MNIRSIRPEEEIKALQVQSVAFSKGINFDTVEIDEEGYENIRAAFNDDGVLFACMRIIPMMVHFNNEIIQLGGVGDVATLPEYRRRGGIRRLMQASLAEMRERGMWLSYLFPFSIPYYRQFGYETCMYKTKAVIPTAAFQQFSTPGTVRAYYPGEDDSIIRQLYNAFSSQYNFMAVRDDALWKSHLQTEPYGNDYYTYIYSDQTGTPRAYISFAAKKLAPYTFDMEIAELIWTTPQGLRGIFTFLKGFSSHFGNVLWDAPNDLDIKSLFQDSTQIQCEQQECGMARIVDFEQLMVNCKAPAGDGAFTIQIVDPFLEWNNASFAVHWENKKISIMRCNSKPDLICSIQMAVRLMSGFSCLDHYFYSEEAKRVSNIETLRRFFMSRKLYLCDGF